VPDLAVAAPFQDGDFLSTDASYGRPQNVKKIFLLDGTARYRFCSAMELVPSALTR